MTHKYRIDPRTKDQLIYDTYRFVKNWAVPWHKLSNTAGTGIKLKEELPKGSSLDCRYADGHISDLYAERLRAVHKEHFKSIEYTNFVFKYYNINTFDEIIHCNVDVSTNLSIRIQRYVFRYRQYIQYQADILLNSITNKPNPFKK